MFEIKDSMVLDDRELSWSFVRSGGPGGQNVNKVASKAVLRWDMKLNESVPPAVKSRLRTLQRRRVTGDDEVVITSQKYRDQDRNRQDCLEKLRQMLLEACAVPKPRKATKPTRGSQERRLQAKKARSRTKSLRRGTGME